MEQASSAHQLKACASSMVAGAEARPTSLFLLYRGAPAAPAYLSPLATG